MSSAEYSYKLFKPILESSLIWVYTVYKNDFQNHKQMTKQTTIVVIGSLRIKLLLQYY